jgi:hypothetical protein
MIFSPFDPSFVRQFDDCLIDDWRVRKIQSAKRLDFGEVVQVGLEYIPLQGEICELPLAGDLDKSCCLQFFHMVGKGGGADGLLRAHVGARGTAAGGNLLEDLVAARVGEGARNQAELAVGQSSSFCVSHVCDTYGAAEAAPFQNNAVIGAVNRCATPKA